ncbi:MAG: SprT-like domain-containing protein [Gammaproteobacteria bacterium]
MSDCIQPISKEQCQQVQELTYQYIDKARECYDFKSENLPVLFDLKGRAAGMYRVRNKFRLIRYNPFIFAKYYADNLATTVPHEVAHYVSDCLYGLKKIKPHGREWQQIMQHFGADASVTCQYDMTGIPVRRQRRISYICDCQQYDLSMLRHNRLMRGEAKYRCRLCGSALRPDKSAGV